MIYQRCTLDTATVTRPSGDCTDLDAFLIEDDADEFLDRHLAAIRESLSDFRQF
jgi:hypothetical protein